MTDRTDRRVRTCLWFDADGEAAARFYVSLFTQNGIGESVIEEVTRTAPEGSALVVAFRLAGAPFMALNGGPTYALTPAASISVQTADQAETDALWDALTADGGNPGRCGWLVDRFGLSWQITPGVLPTLLGAADAEAAGRAGAAMMQMTKIDIAALEAAFRGDAGAAK